MRVFLSADSRIADHDVSAGRRDRVDCCSFRSRARVFLRALIGAISRTPRLRPGLSPHPACRIGAQKEEKKNLRRHANIGREKKFRRRLRDASRFPAAAENVRWRGRGGEGNDLSIQPAPRSGGTHSSREIFVIPYDRTSTPPAIPLSRSTISAVNLRRRHRQLPTRASAGTKVCSLPLIFTSFPFACERKFVRFFRLASSGQKISKTSITKRFSREQHEHANRVYLAVPRWVSFHLSSTRYSSLFKLAVMPHVLD